MGGLNWSALVSFLYLNLPVTGVAGLLNKSQRSRNRGQLYTMSHSILLTLGLVCDVTYFSCGRLEFCIDR